MTGGLLQLVAYGAQDIYLTGKPQITFFKSVYRRHTNFALESILQFTTNVSEQKEVEFAIPIKRGADLLTDIQIDFETNHDLFSVEDFVAPSPPGYIAYQLIDYVELLIGGKPISKIYGEWMMVWAELTLRKNTNRDPFEACIRSEGGLITDAGKPINDLSYYSNTRLPLLFWFHNNPGLAIPLIALQYDDVVLNLRFKDRRRLVDRYRYYPGAYNDFNTFPPTGYNPEPKEFDFLGWKNYPFTNVKVYAEFAFLDFRESKQFAQNAHNYLIEQTQYVSQSNISVANTTLNLNFSHPVKSLIWYALSSYNDLWVDDLAKNGNTTVSKYAIGVFVSNSYEYAKLILNGKDRLAKRKISYFERYQVYKHFPGLSPLYRSNYPLHYVENFPYPLLIDQHFYPLPVSVYSFAVRPFASEPSGTCNFSIISDARLILENITQANRLDTFKVWAQNYNLLRVSAGQGGVVYSN